MNIGITAIEMWGWDRNKNIGSRFGAVFTTVATENKMLRRAVWTGTGEVLKAADIGITSVEAWPRNNSSNVGSREPSFTFNIAVSEYNHAVIRGTYWKANQPLGAGHEIIVQGWNKENIYTGSREPLFLHI